MRGFYFYCTNTTLPTGNLDYNTTLAVLSILKEMNIKLEQSIILVTHDPKVATYADRVVFIHDGQIVDDYIKTKETGDINIILEKFKKILEA